MDLSKLSDSDLQQIAKGDLRMVSEAGLKMLAGEESGVSEVAQKPKQGNWLKPELPYGNMLGGAVQGAADIGSTMLAPIDYLGKVLPAWLKPELSREGRREDVSSAIQSAGADSESIAFKWSRLGTQIAGTAGVGGGIANTVSRVPQLAKYAPVIESGGFNLGNAATASKLTNAGLRAGGGAIAGGATAGLINPEDVDTGAMLGAAMPGAVKVAGTVGSKIKGEVSDSVINLVKKANSLGIDIPADRIGNSRPLNALASSLNYVPLSGRAGVEKNMLSQFNRAVSRTFGQDSDNVTMALRKAGSELGKQFDDTLSKTTVKVDAQFIDDLAKHEQTIMSELDPMQAKVVSNQINAILEKTQNGLIDGQAAYNIKKTLDRIGNRNSNEAYYAREVKKSLMGALNRSLPDEEAKAFAKLRAQYGNMLDLEGVARNGAEGGVSIGKLANMKGINNPELQDLADIAAQFLVTREAPHGAAQRVTLGALGLGAGGVSPATIPLMAAGVAGARGANSALNSTWMKNSMTGVPPQLLKKLGDDPLLRSGLLAISANP